MPDRVVGRNAWLSVTLVPERLRLTDMPLAGGYFVLFSASGRFCVVDQREWTSGPHDGEVYACRWRYPRGPR